MNSNPLSFFGLLSVAMLFINPVIAEEVKVTKCDPIYKEVHTAVTAEPDKVLLIVEENTLASPDCVCEIIKAAVTATQASADLTRQIMLTALNAAPEKAKIIEICIAALAAERGDKVVKKSGKDVEDVRSGKEGKDVQYVRGGKEGSDIMPMVASEKGVMIQRDLTPPPGPSDYSLIPPDIRGVYLIQPSSGGFSPRPPTRKPEPPDKEDPPKRPRPNPPRGSDPQSPSSARIHP